MNTCTAFVASHKLANGLPEDVSSQLRLFLRRNPQAACIVIEDLTGHALRLDDTGEVTLPPVPENTPALAKGGPGRPRLGVVAREVTLLPRHWEWLANQPGGASVALRKLVEAACDESHARDKARLSLEACHRAMALLAGDLPDYEEASKALLKGDFLHLGTYLQGWPEDIRKYLGSFIATAWHAACNARR